MDGVDVAAPNLENVHDPFSGLGKGNRVLGGNAAGLLLARKPQINEKVLPAGGLDGAAHIQRQLSTSYGIAAVFIGAVIGQGEKNLDRPMCMNSR